MLTVVENDDSREILADLETQYEESFRGLFMIKSTSNNSELCTTLFRVLEQITRQYVEESKKLPPQNQFPRNPHNKRFQFEQLQKYWQWIINGQISYDERYDDVHLTILDTQNKIVRQFRNLQLIQADLPILILKILRQPGDEILMKIIVKAEDAILGCHKLNKLLSCSSLAAEFQKICGLNSLQQKFEEIYEFFNGIDLDEQEKVSEFKKWCLTIEKWRKLLTACQHRNDGGRMYSYVKKAFFGITLCDAFCWFKNSESWLIRKIFFGFLVLGAGIGFFALRAGVVNRKTLFKFFTVKENDGNNARANSIIERTIFQLLQSKELGVCIKYTKLQQEQLAKDLQHRGLRVLQYFDIMMRVMMLTRRSFWFRFVAGNGYTLLRKLTQKPLENYLLRDDTSSEDDISENDNQRFNNSVLFVQK